MDQEMFHDVNQPQNFKTFVFETISEESFILKYMNEIGHYSKTFTFKDDFWKQNSKYFLDQFNVFKDVLQECLTNRNSFLSYEIFNESNKMLSLIINHNSPIHLNWSITINLDNDQYKIKMLELKVKELELEVENVKLENKSLRIKSIHDERGVIIVNPPETDRVYSSTWNDDSIGKTHAISCLDSNGCWAAKINDKKQWMIIDLKDKKEIRGFINMARYNYEYEQQVTKLIFLISDDKVIWTNCGEFECTAVDANNEKYINPKRKVSVGKPLNARYIKIIPTEWENHISMRFGLLVKEYSKKDKVNNI